MEENTIIDVDLSVTRKKRFRINGDDNCMLELNISDMNILTRLKDVIPKMNNYQNNALDALEDLSNADDIEVLTKISDALVSIDADMRQMIDYLFDSNVSELCAPSGNMYDPFGGEFRWEHIIDVIGALYSSNLTEEFKKINERIKKHTSKYTKKRK